MDGETRPPKITNPDALKLYYLKEPQTPNPANPEIPYMLNPQAPKCLKALKQTELLLLLGLLKLHVLSLKVFRVEGLGLGYTDRIRQGTSPRLGVDPNRFQVGGFGPRMYLQCQLLFRHPACRHRPHCSKVL